MPWSAGSEIQNGRGFTADDLGAGEQDRRIRFLECPDLARQALIQGIRQSAPTTSPPASAMASKSVESVPK
jgi:hypothetical protein